MSVVRSAAALLALFAAAPAFGQAVVPDAPDPNVVPFEVREVTVQEKLGETVPAGCCSAITPATWWNWATCSTARGRSC